MENIIDIVSDSLGIEKNFVYTYFNKNHSFYRKIQIPKRKGGKRTIFLPNSEIKLIQHFVLERYLSKIEISDSACAYFKGKSILDNVMPHIKKKHFLFVDISDFFDNMKQDIIICKLKAAFIDLTDSDIIDIVKICTYEGKFVQGAVTSPAISNIYLSDFDFKIKKMVEEKLGGVYTRYSDDITISASEKIDIVILDEIKKELNNYGLKINEKKTYFSSYLQKIEITGLKILNNKTSIDTQKKEKLKNMIFHKLKYKNNSREKASKILGYLNYLMHVDPNYYNVLNLKYKKGSKNLVARLVQLNEMETELNNSEQ